MLSFKQFKTKLLEFSNSASSQATGISGSEGKAPGKGASATTNTNTNTNTQVKGTTEKERHDNEDVKYVRDNLKYTKVIEKKTKTRILNHHNHK